MATLEEFLDETREQGLRELEDFLRIPSISSLPEHADDVRRADVIELVEGIVTAGKPVLANRVQSLISSIFSFALDADLLSANPCARLRKRGEETAGTRAGF